MTPYEITALEDDLRNRADDVGYPKSELYQQAADALAEQGWREVETNNLLKGRRRSPAYFPATGETCEVSGPNCDDATGYTWMKMTVLWQDDKFVVYGQEGFWPNLHKHEHVLFRPLPTAPAGGSGNA